MNDDYFSKNNRSSNRNNSSSHRSEPAYEADLSQEEIDSLFSQRDVFSKNENPQNGKFKVTLPDEETRITHPVPNQSRVPKGKPVGQTPYSSSVYSSKGTSNNDSSNFTPQPKSYYEANNISSSSSGVSKNSPIYSQNPTQNVNRSVKGKTPVGGTDITSKSKPTFSSDFPVKRTADSVRRENQKKTAQPKKKKSSGKKKAAVAILCVFLVLFASLFAYGYSILGKISYDESTVKENQYIDESLLATSADVKNILFIGSDARNEIAGMRSDTMILFSIDTANKKIKLTSFLRDSYVCIPSTGRYRKLNASCSSGGAQLVIDTIEYNFKTKIDNYVLVDFEAFTKFIDLMGGLDVPDVTAAEAKYLRNTVKITYAKEGTNHFSGAATLWYCRIRYLDDDFHRTQRQRKVISAIISQVSKTSPAALMNIVEEILPMITTDIPRNQLISFGMGALTKYMRYDILQHQIPASGTWSDATVYGEGSVLKMDIDKNAELLKDFLYSKYTEEEETTKEK